MKVTTAQLTLQSLSPYSQSRYHEEPKLKGELADAYDRRTWKSHCLFQRIGKKNVMMIPAHGFIQTMIAAAKYSKKQIPGQGKATWTAKFQAGIMIMDDIPTSVEEKDIQFCDIYANADGIRGSAKRVMRRYPLVGWWMAMFPVTILDPIITQEVFREIVDLAGMFVGLGRFRPEKGGFNGRFRIADMQWIENREFENGPKEIRK
jgi:hypothetical protein